MASRTYVPTIIKVCRSITRFIGKYREQLTENMTPSQLVLLDALLDAANNLLDVLEIVQAN